MKNWTQKGDIIQVTAPSGGVTSGQFIKVGQLAGWCIHDAAEGDPVSLQLTGCGDIPKKSGDTPAQGALVYWDDTNKYVTTTATSNLLVGAVTAAALSGDATANVRLNGIARANEAGS